jgi:hypothetical protein
MIFYFVLFLLLGQLAIICSSTPLYPDRKVPTIKDLEKPWAALAPRVLRPASRTPVDPKSPSSKWTGHSAATTLLLDDSHAKAALQPHNHLCVLEYTRTQRNADLTALELERAVQQQRQEQELEQHSSPVSHLEGSRATPDATVDTSAHKRAVSSPDGSSSATEIEQSHKRKRKKKKKDKVQARAQQQLAAIATAADGTSPAAAVLDETLLAVIGVLHAARLQSSVAGWLRAGALLYPPFSERASVVGDGGGDGETWCHDPVLVREWASRGREAMHELGLKIEHGIEP